MYLIKVLLDDEPVSSRKVLVNVDKRDDPNDDTSDPDNMTFVLAKMGTNVTLNCSDLGEEEDLVLWTKQNGDKSKDLFQILRLLFFQLVILGNITRPCH